MESGIQEQASVYSSYSIMRKVFFSATFRWPCNTYEYPTPEPETPANFPLFFPYPSSSDLLEPFTCGLFDSLVHRPTTRGDADAAHARTRARTHTLMM